VTPRADNSVQAHANRSPDATVDSYRKLADVFHEVLSERSLDELLHRIADTVGELVPYDDITFYEADEAKRELKAVYASGEEAAMVLADEPFPYGAGITGWAAEHRVPVLANRAELDPRVLFVADTAPDPESLIVVPLIARGALKGTLNIYRVGFQEFLDDEFTLVVRFADAAALAIDNAHVHASLELQAQTDSLTGLWNHRAFHERLRGELVRSSAQQDSTVLVMIDLDDFKKVNDVYGHALGDTVLIGISEILRGSVRTSDDVCRIGGEEFAIVVPGGTLEDGCRLAERISKSVSTTPFDPVGAITLSIGVTAGPLHAANPRELVACGEMAMMTAKATGRGRTVVFEEGNTERPDEERRGVEYRSIAHLKMLHGVSSKLSRLNDVAAIGATIAEELRLLIDYHNCRVLIRDDDMLELIAFRGDLTADGPAGELLVSRIGEGVTGRVAQTGESFRTGDAANCGIGRQIEGTERIEESLVAVPFVYGHEVVGVIVVSKLGLDQFDADDQRLLEVLAGHASVALVNAGLYERERREAASAKALLELSRELSSQTELSEVLLRVVAGATRITGSGRASVWLPERATGGLECAASIVGGVVKTDHRTSLSPSVVALFSDRTEPFVLTVDEAEMIARALSVRGRGVPHLVAPMQLEWGLGVLAVASGPGTGARELDLLEGIANQARLAIASTQNFETLERTFLSTVEALANALEANDEYTSSHARWISDMAIRVGSELGLSPVALKRVELGALFHDIGKIGVPSSILMKPGPLTSEERTIIEQHPELGERILAPIEQLAEVRPIVRACHERFDGRGYPDGLGGEEIPIEARIIFACDAFHAMTSDRPYRDALPKEEALRRLAEASGTQFDPRVIEVCLRVMQATV
jgi:diguanylate cyclase (GGDEF)-like protein